MDPAALLYDAIVLAGGRSSRLGEGRNKALLRLEGTALLERVANAVVSARQIVVVAPADTVESAGLSGKVTQTLENPPFGGPVAGILAGLDSLEGEVAPVVAILACDLPWARPATQALLESAEMISLGAGNHADGVCAGDMEQRPQQLLGFYRTEFLQERARKVASGRDLSVKRFLAGARLITVNVPSQYVQDIDSPDDLDRYLRQIRSENE